MKTTSKFLLWTPRILGILFVLFISLFALDIFEMGLGPLETLIGLVMHLLPSIVLTVGILLAWRWYWPGAVAFVGWVVWYVSNIDNRDWLGIVLLVIIPLLIAALYFTDWLIAQKAHSQQPA